MPITLQQLSRRAFIKCAALTSTALACGLQADAGLFFRHRNRHRFALLADTHIAADPNEVSRGVNMADHLKAVVQQVLGHPGQPTATFINGDLALKNGQPGDYTTFKQLIQPLQAVIPIHLTLGNHDERDHFLEAFATDTQKSCPVPERYCKVLETGRANLYLLDSLDKTDSTPGEIGALQREWLERELTARPKKPAIIFAHHNLNQSGLIAGLKDTTAFAAQMAVHPQVKAFVFGHTHDWNIRQNESGVHLVNLPPVAYTFAAERPSGWVCAEILRDGMKLELISLDPKHPEHGKVEELKWR